MRRPPIGEALNLPVAVKTPHPGQIMDTWAEISIICGILGAMATITAAPLADPQQIQGNILRAFAGRHQAFLALSFRNNRAGARRWLGALALRVAGTGDVGAARKDPGRSMLNVGLTATGLVLLHGEVAGQLVAYDAFWRGPLGLRLDDDRNLTTAPALLGDVGDSDPAGWVIGRPSGAPVDALVTVAADDERTLRSAMAREWSDATNNGLEVLRVEQGEALYDGDQLVEHFGFADGISQPGIRGFHDSDNARPGSPMIAAGEFVLGCVGERRPQGWTPRPVPPPWMRGGSFQVFRRLRQNVAGWRDHMESLGDPTDAAAKALGRHRDGRPLAPDARDDRNDFDYRSDEPGEHTPLNAHIRKVNPRDDQVFRDRGHKLLRRGITFGPRYDDAPDNPERGILFNAYMASIEDQFEFVQRRWSADPEFPATTLSRYGREPRGEQRVDGLDPILGPDRTTAEGRLPKAVYEAIKPAGFGGFVTTTGAVYAFAPSRPALAQLAGEQPLD